MKAPKNGMIRVFDLDPTRNGPDSGPLRSVHRIRVRRGGQWYNLVGVDCGDDDLYHQGVYRPLTKQEKNDFNACASDF